MVGVGDGAATAGAGVETVCWRGIASADKLGLKGRGEGEKGGILQADGRAWTAQSMPARARDGLLGGAVRGEGGVVGTE